MSNRYLYGNAIEEEIEHFTPSARRGGRGVRSKGALYNSTDFESKKDFSKFISQNFFTPDPRHTARNKLKRDQDFYRSFHSQQSKRFWIP